MPINNDYIQYPAEPQLVNVRDGSGAGFRKGLGHTQHSSVFVAERIRERTYSLKATPTIEEPCHVQTRAKLHIRALKDKPKPVRAAVIAVTQAAAYPHSCGSGLGWWLGIM